MVNLIFYIKNHIGKSKGKTSSWWGIMLKNLLFDLIGSLVKISI